MIDSVAERRVSRRSRPIRRAIQAVSHFQNKTRRKSGPIQVDHVSLDDESQPGRWRFPMAQQREVKAHFRTARVCLVGFDCENIRPLHQPSRRHRIWKERCFINSLDGSCSQGSIRYASARRQIAPKHLFVLQVNDRSIISPRVGRQIRICSRVGHLKAMSPPMVVYWTFPNVRFSSDPGHERRYGIA